MTLGEAFLRTFQFSPANFYLTGAPHLSLVCGWLADLEKAVPVDQFHNTPKITTEVINICHHLYSEQLDVHSVHGEGHMLFCMRVKLGGCLGTAP